MNVDYRKRSYPSLRVKMRLFTRLFCIGMVAIAAGSWLPDIDHLFKGQGRTWGHHLPVPAIICGIVVVALIGRQVRARILEYAHSRS